MQLTIVIPAFNEEQSIASTISRSLALKKAIPPDLQIRDIRIVVVSDGSTDKTAQIAQSFKGIDVVVFPKNKGYGAAIKAGWAHAGGDLLGFLDADGTCDPFYFFPMCREILKNDYDVVLGCRMNRDSKMPLVRRIGNTIFALLLGFLSKKKVFDTASGMRVIRAVALPRLLPLPNGMHFTPAISARSLMDEDIKITEINMTYSEREGSSKLRAIRDGFRFLGVIISAAAYIRVSRLTMPLMFLLALVATLLMVHPLFFYAMNFRLEEWMFYRYVFAGMLGTLVGILLCFTIISEHTSALAHLRYHQFHSDTRGLWRYQTLKTVTIFSGILWLIGFLLNVSVFYELVHTGHVSLHWSRVLLGAFSTIFLTQLVSTLLALKIIRALHQRQPYLTTDGSLTARKNEF